MDKKLEQTIEKLLEENNYIVYEIDSYYHSMIIEDPESLADNGCQYDFKWDI